MKPVFTKLAPVVSVGIALAALPAVPVQTLITAAIEMEDATHSDREIISFFTWNTSLEIKKINFNVTSKEFFLSIGSMLILITSAIVFIGTSLPLVKDVKIEISSYTNWNLPVAILILLTNAISLYLNWYGTEFKVIMKK